ncbi:FAD-dependent oxidoreductase [Pullulanibacillus sp. KACC 23026]|nr:FAD-dependent oxidoreductase [Pullulanibacillus sp. KACC 23026]WEG15017.1 FAD-dependent oxidoreductase [Pullulanibacillus sp. KACC 23026]
MTVPKFDALKEDLNVDVCIVGGGIVGITAAYLLAKEDVSVALIEASRLLGGTTGHTTAKLTTQHGLIYDELIEHIGLTNTRLYLEANIEAISFIREKINQYKIDCDLSEEDAYLYSTSDHYAKKLEKEFKAYQKLDIRSDLLDDIPLGIKVHNALKWPHQYQFHPLRYLKTLLDEFIKDGGKVFEETTAVDIKEGKTKTEVLTRNGVSIHCQSVLCCSHFPFYEGRGFYFSRLHADRTYLMAVTTDYHYPGGHYLNVDPPKRTIRSAQHNGRPILIIGGESHKTGQGKNTIEHYKAIEAFGKEHFNIKDILFRWSAQDLTSLDKIPYIGSITKGQRHILVATGFRKWGMSNGTAAALLLKDLVLKKDNRFKDVFTPSRFYADPSLKKFLIQNADVAKHLIKGKMGTPSMQLEDLSKDEGGVVTVNGKRRGAYRDKEGNVYIVDTTCTHMGCECNWNQGDRTWDCPCHGSRYSYKGEVIEGPAEKPLKQDEDFTIGDVLTSDDSGY